jgi:hypothetical protein
VVWFHYVTDVGLVGPDRGKGGKYLVLPPGYAGEIPDGYFVVKMTTYEGFLGWRNFAFDGDFQPAIDSMKKHARVYPLARADNPEAKRFVDVFPRERIGARQKPQHRR